MTDLIGEPIVSDDRVTRVEQVLRQKYPQIPETAEFATYLQPRVWTKVSGIDREIPETAVFLVRVPSPKHDHKDIVLVERGAELLKVWQVREKNYQRYVGVPDPLVAHFETVLRSLADKHRNLRTMLN